METTIFVERQYFDAGKQTDFFASGAAERPHWLPKLDAVAGFGNDDGILRGEDYVFEVVRIQCKNGDVDHYVTWIGCFIPSLDLTSPERGTVTAGFGLWFVDCWGDISGFVQHAEQLARKFAVPNGDSTDKGLNVFKANAQGLINSFNESQSIQPLDNASVNWGLNWTLLPSILSTSYVTNTEQRSAEYITSFLNFLIHAPRYGEWQKLGATNRCLIGICNPSTFALEVHPAPTREALYSAQIEAFKAESRQLISDRITLQKLRPQYYQLDQEVKRLQNDKEKLRAELVPLQARITEFKQNYPELLNSLPLLKQIHNPQQINAINQHIASIERTFEDGMRQVNSNVQRLQQSIDDDKHSANAQSTSSSKWPLAQIISILLSALILVFLLFFNSNKDNANTHPPSKQGKTSMSKPSISLPSQSKGVEFVGRMARVKDGDTMVVAMDNGSTIDVRLSAIDAPESDQLFGHEAMLALSNLCFGVEVDVRVVDIDRYGRSVGQVRCNDTDVHQSLIASGHAWVYDKYVGNATYLYPIQQTAKQKQVGLWQFADSIAPWEWRKLKKSSEIA